MWKVSVILVVKLEDRKLIDGTNERTILAMHSGITKFANAEVRIFASNTCASIVAYFIFTNLKLFQILNKSMQ